MGKTKTSFYEELTYLSEDYIPIGEMRQAIEFVLMAAYESANRSQKSFFQSEECHSKHFYLLDNHIRNTSHITTDQDVSRSLYLENNEKLEFIKLISLVFYKNFNSILESKFSIIVAGLEFKDKSLRFKCIENNYKIQHLKQHLEYLISVQNMESLTLYNRLICMKKPMNTHAQIVKAIR